MEENTPLGNGSSKPASPRPRMSAPTMWVMLFVLLVALLLIFNNQGPQRSEIDYSFFRQQVEAGNVAEVDIQGQQVFGKFKVPPYAPATDKKLTETVKLPGSKEPDTSTVDAGKTPEANPGEASKKTDAAKPTEKAGPKKLHENFTVFLSPLVGEDLDKLLLAKGVTIKAQPPGDSANLLMLVWIGLTVLFLVFMWSNMRRARDQIMGGGMFSGFAKSPAKRYDTNTKRVTFADVAGLEGVKADLEEIVEFLKSPEKFQRLGGRVPKGVLLMGPPGTGKTLLARAVAGEAGVPFFSISGSEFIQMFVGVGAGRVRDLFKTAKESSPAILFIDEIDAVGRQRGAGLGGGHDEREQTLNQILSEMDGFSQTESVIVLAATNRPDVLDPALLRPGRFDRHITVDRPTQKGRREIFAVHCRNVRLGSDVNLNKLASGTIGLTGADIRNLVNEAALWATRQGKDKVEMADFEYARDKILMGPKREEILSGKEKSMTAYHEAGHALLAWIIPGADVVHKVTIIPRGRALGVTQLLPPEDRLSIGEKVLHARLTFLLGGRAAEKLVFDEYSAGAENDLKEATKLARRMVTHWGMSEKIGPVAYHSSEEHPFLGREMSHEQREFSERTAALIDDEVTRILHAAGERARSMLEEHRDKLDMLTHALEEREMISHEEIEEMLGPSATQPTRAELDVETPEAPKNGQPGHASPKPETAS